MAKLTENQQKWKVHVDAAAAAGESLAAYARSNDLELKKLYSYSRALQQRLKPAPKAKFVRVTAASAVVNGLRVELANGVRVHIGVPTDLGSLLSQLAKLP